MELFIRLQYQMGKITKEQVLGFVPTYLTEDQAQNIMGELSPLEHI